MRRAPAAYPSSGRIPQPDRLAATLPAAAVLLDPRRLSDALGRPARHRYLRWKPGTCLVAAVDTDDGGQWWAAAFVDPAKHHKVARRGPLVPLGPGCAAGSLELDRALHRGLARLHTWSRGTVGAQHPVVQADPGPAQPSPPSAPPRQVLRYNPFRRVVARMTDPAGEPWLARVTRPGAGPQPLTLTDLHRGGVGPAVLASAPRYGLTALAWVPGRVRPALSAGDELAVGEALRQLALTPTRHDMLPRYDLSWWIAALHQAVRATEALDPGLGALAAGVAGRLAEAYPDGPHILVHGDLSPDQIVWSDGRPRLIDFDRIGVGPGDLDTAGLLLARCSAAGPAAAVEAPPGLRRVAAHAALRRVTEPFRTGSPDWPAAIRRRLALAAALVR